MVAEAQLLAHAHALHPGPVRSASRRSPTLHPHAQDTQGTAARLALSGLQSRLLHQDVQCGYQPLQGTRFVVVYYRREILFLHGKRLKPVFLWNSDKNLIEFDHGTL